MLSSEMLKQFGQQTCQMLADQASVEGKATSKGGGCSQATTKSRNLGAALSVRFT